MSEPDLSAILADLAAGRIDAAEAARLIEEARVTDGASRTEGDRATGGDRRTADAGASGPRATPQPEPEPEEPEPAGPTGVKGTDKVSIRAVGRRVRIFGDPSVATASAEGPHVLRRQGGVLEITSDGELGPSLEGFSVLRPPRSLDDLRTLGLGKGLTIRVNPAIEVDVEVTAGSLGVEGVPFLGRVRVTAGGATVHGVRRITDALVQAGQATVEGPIRVGRSRIKVESGSLSVVLAPRANVTVRAESQMGRVQWPDEQANVDEYTVGNGSARLDIEVVMGGATIKRQGTES